MSNSRFCVIYHERQIACTTPNDLRPKSRLGIQCFDVIRCPCTFHRCHTFHVHNSNTKQYEKSYEHRDIYNSTENTVRQSIIDDFLACAMSHNNPLSSIHCYCIANGKALTIRFGHTAFGLS